MHDYIPSFTDKFLYLTILDIIVLKTEYWPSFLVITELPILRDAHFKILQAVLSDNFAFDD